MIKGVAPLYNRLISHISNFPVSFHVPGHKMGKGFNPIGKKYYSKILKLDMTEISGLDDLHDPKGVILEAEKRAAKIFQASRTFFLVNGSTTGNIAMILTVCKPGDKILVQRNVHKSIINGLILAKANPVYIDTEHLIGLEIAGNINKGYLKEVLKIHSDAKAVFIMNPNYYGIGTDLEEIISLIHEYKIPVLVDEAHGAHFGLHSLFPKSAIQSGADIVVNSTHKTLSAMTMGSMLHVNSNLINIDRLKMFLTMIQTSSPSYPILTSLDLTCEWIEREKEELWDNTLKLIDDFNKKAKLLNNIKTKHDLPKKYYIDPLKIIMNVSNLKYSGIELQRFLEERNIYTELADTYNNLAIVTLGTRKRDLKHLFNTLIKIDQKLINDVDRQKNKIINFQQSLSRIQDTYSEISIEEIIYGENELVLLKDAVGRVACEMVTPYPPGIPVLQIGERITIEIIEYLLYIKKNGVNIQGLRGDNYNKIKVVKNY